MRAPRSNCCISSRVGAAIVGGLSLIGTICGMVPLGIALSWYRHRSYRASHYSDGLPEMCLQTFLFVHACSCMLMMYGAIKGKAGLMLPWLGIFVTVITISISVSVATVINYALSGGWRRDLSEFSAFLGILMIATALKTLLCAIVYDRYKQLVSGRPVQTSRPYTVNEGVIDNPFAYHKV